MSAHARASIRVVVTVRGGERTERRTIDALDGVLTLGRDSRCTVALDTAFASRQHAIVDVQGSLMSVRDTSMNGTNVGPAVVRKSVASFPFGTPITIGPYAVVLEREASPRPAAPAKLRTALERGPLSKRKLAAAPLSRAAVRAAVGVRDVAPAAAQERPGPFSSNEGRVDALAKENALRTEIHKRLLEHLDLAAVDGARNDDPTLRPKVLAALRKIVEGLADRVPPGVDRDVLVGSLLDEAIGLGPVERYLSDPSVNEIMVVDPNTIFLEMNGKLVRADARFTNDDRVRATIERIVTPLGRRIDESVPLVDARLADGSRVNAVIKPLALRGAAITIRKFSRKPFTLDRLIEFGALTDRMADGRAHV